MATFSSSKNSYFKVQDSKNNTCYHVLVGIVTKIGIEFESLLSDSIILLQTKLKELVSFRL